MVHVRCGAVALAVVLLAAHASADPTVYSTEAAYNAATGSQLFLIDFTGAAGIVDGGVFSSEVTFGSPEATDPTKVLHSSNALSDAGSTMATNFVGPVDGVFTTPVNAFALVFSSASEAEMITLRDAGNAIIDVVVAPNPSGFFGVTSLTPIKSFVIDNGIFPSSMEPDRFFIDDFRANAFPEPGVLTLLAIAGAFAWRRRQRA